MSDLRTAAQQALEALEFMADEWGFTQKANRPERWQAIEALRAALEQQDEPKGGGNLPPPLQAEPVQEPAAWQWLNTAHFRKNLPVNAESGAWNPLYTRPPRREWQSLSEEESNELSHMMVKGHKSVNWLARAIEAALKEKNA